MKKADIFLAVASLCAAILFFLNVGHLWPLAHHELLKDSAQLEADVSTQLQAYQIETKHYQRKSRLRIHDQALQHLETALDQQQAAAYVHKGLPLLYYKLSYKEAGNPVYLTCHVHPNGQLLGWHEHWPRDKAAGEQNRDQALIQATQCIINAFALRSIELIEERKRRYEARHDFEFTFAYVHQAEPLIKEEIHVIVSGQQIRKAWRQMIIPAKAERALQQASAPSYFLAIIGFISLSCLSIFAIIKLLLLMNKGQSIKLVASLWICAGLTLLLLTNTLLQDARLFEYWDPLWPGFIAYTEFIFLDLLYSLVPLVPLLGFLVVATRIDTDQNLGRMTSFWSCMRGQFYRADVQRSSLQGFAVGFLCGASLVLSVLLIGWCFGSDIALQPRGFFFYTINSSISIITCICWFGYIAMLEEGAYRLFAGNYLMQRFGSKALAIIIPGIIYGLCHAQLTFLPPDDPFWARAACLSVVGCVWGWAFFRYDALTVILSHFAADLFIFNWPLIASEEILPKTMAIISITIPLWPAIIGYIWNIFKASHKGTKAPSI